MSRNPTGRKTPKTIDRRGFAPTVGDATDLGAFESRYLASPHSSNTASAAGDPSRGIHTEGKTKVRVTDAVARAELAALAPSGGFTAAAGVLVADTNGDGSAELTVTAVIRGKPKKRICDRGTLA